MRSTTATHYCHTHNIQEEENRWNFIARSETVLQCSGNFCAWHVQSFARRSTNPCFSHVNINHINLVCLKSHSLQRRFTLLITKRVRYYTLCLFSTCVCLFSVRFVRLLLIILLNIVTTLLVVPETSSYFEAGGGSDTWLLRV